MKTNLKHSIVFILTVVTLLLVVATSLAASKPVNQVGEKGLSTPINSTKNGKGSGLGMNIFYTDLNEDEYRDVLLANFGEFRWLLDYDKTAWIKYSHSTIINSVALGAKIVYGVTAPSPLILANWNTFADAVKTEALWSQNNGVYEFQIGNELEYKMGHYCAAGKLVRLNNVVTVTTPVPHGFDGLHQVTVFPQYWNSGLNPANMSGTFDITVIDSTHFSYIAPGADGSNLWDCRVTDLPLANLITNIKTLATQVKAIYTRGNVTYTFAHPWTNDWCSAGKGDLDLIGSNIYQDNEGWRDDAGFTDRWKTEIDNLIAAFGTDGIYLSEFGLSSRSLETWSTDEAVQEAAITKMIEYIKSKGITRADFYCWKDYEDVTFGVVNMGGNYRLLWNAFNSGAAVSDITISTASKDFGSVDIAATTNPGQIFTITNTGTVSLNLGTITISGTDASQFIKSNDTASGQAIEAGASKTLKVTFDPSTIGAKTASISIPSNDPDSPALTVNLSGTATETTDTTEQTIETTPETTPDTTAPVTTEQTVETTPETTPDTTAPVTTEQTVETTQDTTPETTVSDTTEPSETTPDTTAPDTTEQTVGTTPETTIDTTTPDTTIQPVNTAPSKPKTSASTSKGKGGSSSSKSLPNDPIKAFVTRLYQLCFSRDPDSAGLNGWASDLKTGSKTGADVAYGFIFSEEFIKRNVSNEEYIKILYRAFFNREADSGGYNGWLTGLNAGNSRIWVLAGFINSQEFKNLCTIYGINPGSL